MSQEVLVFQDLGSCTSLHVRMLGWWDAKILRSSLACAGIWGFRDFGIWGFGDFEIWGFQHFGIGDLGICGFRDLGIPRVVGDYGWPQPVLAGHCRPVSSVASHERPWLAIALTLQAVLQK